ncbi:MAG: hypothetical protein ABEI86_11270, partial [Halobacteriaceae archaeon]
PEWDKNKIFREANAGETSVPGTYEEVLRRVYASQETLTTAPMGEMEYHPWDIFRLLDSDKTVLELSSTTLDIEVPLIEREDWPDKLAQIPRYAQYNAKEFSPYALCTGGEPSIAIVKVKGSPFCREKVTIGNRKRPVHALIPSYFYGARGCVGDEFTKDGEHAPLQLSKPDYAKWNYECGDHVVIIGGKSNHSRISSVTPREASEAGQALNGEDGSRQTALDYLTEKGYDVGSRGRSTSLNGENHTANSSPGSQNSKGSEPTMASKLQRKAEEKGIDTLDHTERGRIACRLLLFGWDEAWSWFREQFGDSFDPEITR